MNAAISSNRIVVAFASTVALALALFLYRGAPRRSGDQAELAFTFIPRDVTELECRGAELPLCDLSLRGARMIPAMTTEGGLYLLQGVFAVPNVADFVRKQRGGERRFTATCSVVYGERVRVAQIRFRSKDEFVERKSTWQVRPLECRVSYDPR